MRACFLIVLFLLGPVILESQNDPKQKYIQAMIEGKWTVVATNFPMWLDGRNKDPNFNYTNFRYKKDKFVFDDLVNYTKNGTPETIKGKDKQRRSGEPDFSWRGKGLLVFFKSNWKVIASDKEGRWLAIYSTKTLVSPEGVDIIARSKSLSAKEIKDIIAHLDTKYVHKPIEVLK